MDWYWIWGSSCLVRVWIVLLVAVVGEIGLGVDKCRWARWELQVLHILHCNASWVGVSFSCLYIYSWHLHDFSFISSLYFTTSRKFLELAMSVKTGSNRNLKLYLFIVFICLCCGSSTALEAFWYTLLIAEPITLAVKRVSAEWRVYWSTRVSLFAFLSSSRFNASFALNIGFFNWNNTSVLNPIKWYCLYGCVFSLAMRYSALYNDDDLDWQ